MYKYNYKPSYDYSYGENIALAVASILVMIFAAFVVLYVVNAFLLMKLFKKAGLKPIYAWIPFYNYWKYFELGGVPGIYSIAWLAAVITYPLILIPFIGIIFTPLTGVIASLSGTAFVIATRNIGKKLGRSEIWLTALGITPVANIAWFVIVNQDSAQWEDSKADPSLAEGTIIGYAVEEVDINEDKSPSSQTTTEDSSESDK